MNIYIALSIIYLLILPVDLSAQTKYLTKRVEYLYNKISESGIDRLSDDTFITESDTVKTEFYKCILKGRDVVIRMERNKEVVVHVGILLFDQTEMSTYNPITRFLEQKILELLIENDKNLEAYMITDNVYFYMNDVPFASIGFENFETIIPLLQNRDFLEIRKKDFDYYVLWRKGHHDSLKVIFPARQELIVGKDKKELDEDLIQNLQSKEWSYKSSAQGPPYYHRWQNSIYVREGIEYFPGITSSTFYKIKNGQYVPIFDKEYPKESVSNLFIEDLVETDSFGVHIDHHLYGNEIQNYTVSIKQFISFFKQDHDIFIGFEDVKTDSVIATILFVNRFFNHLHLLQINFPIHHIGVRHGVFINGEFYSNIRLDNVKNLFEKYFDKEKLLEILIDN